jgi:hypothetical protein
MKTEQTKGLEKDGEYTEDQLREMEDAYIIDRLRSTGSGTRDYIQRNPLTIYSLKNTGYGKFKVVDNILVGVSYDVEQ